MNKIYIELMEKKNNCTILVVNPILKIFAFEYHTSSQQVM